MGHSETQVDSNKNKLLAHYIQSVSSGPIHVLHFIEHFEHSKSNLL